VESEDHQLERPWSGMWKARTFKQIERGMCVACWSGFPLQGVHRFESPRLSNMSNRLFVAVFT
jgi:hypothetical protein